MAVLDSDNRYLKVNLDETYIDRNGVNLAVDVYSSQADREREKVVDTQMSKFTDNYNQYLYNLSEKAKAIVSKHGITEEQVNSDAAALPENLKSLINVIDGLVSDFHKIMQYLNDENADGEALLKELKSYDLIKSLGFDLSWITDPKKGHTTLVKVSGPYLKQNFNHDGMYSELKKTLIGQTYKDV